MNHVRQREIILQYQHVRRKESSKKHPSTQPSYPQPPVVPIRVQSVNSMNELPSFPQRSDSLESGSPGLFNAVGEQTPQRFVALLANRLVSYIGTILIVHRLMAISSVNHWTCRNTPLKALYRHLTAFRITLSLSTPNFIQDFTQAEVPYLEAHGVRGIRALEIVLDRVLEARRLRSISPAARAPGKSHRAYTRYTMNKPLPQAPNGSYADAVLEDELGLETVRCIKLIMNAEVGYAAVLNCPSLMKHLAYCLAAPDLLASAIGGDIRTRRANLALRTSVAEVLGPLCLLSDNGRT